MIQKLIEKSKNWKGTNIEFFNLSTQSRVAGWADGKPSLIEESLSKGWCIRVLNGGRQGLVTTPQEDEAPLWNCLEKAREISLLSPEDPHRQMASPSKKYSPQPSIDEQIFNEPTGEVLERFKAIEHEVLKSDKRIKRVIKLQYVREKSIRHLINSMGLDMKEESTSATLRGEILAEDGRHHEVGWDFRSSRFAQDIPLKDFALSLAKHAVDSLGGTPLETGNYPVLIQPRVGCEFLELLAQALSAEQVQLGKSFLCGKKNALVANECVTLADDPFFPRGVASSSFDDEGMPRKALTLVAEGRLNSYFYHLKSAHREGIPSTGHASKAGLSAEAKPGPTNFYIKPGTEKRENLLSREKKIFEVHEIMGLHMADPLTGEFSLGASGSLYENGKLVKPIRGVTISGSLESLFKKIIRIGNDLQWYGGMGSPSFLVSELTVAGR